MFLVLRRGAVTTVAQGGELAGAAAIACLRRFAADPAHAEAIAAWRPRPGKVCLRARTHAQWERVLVEEPHALAGDPEGAAVAALPPRRRSERGALLERLQAMSAELDPAPARTDPGDDRAALTYLVTPHATMSSGKVLAQVAHAAVLAAPRHAGWVAAGCPARVLAPCAEAFDALCRLPAGQVAARVEDAGLTEVPPGTVTVLALPPGPAGALPRSVVA
jgi:hypothetical protein